MESHDLQDGGIEISNAPQHARRENGLVGSLRSSEVLGFGARAVAVLRVGKSLAVHKGSWRPCLPSDGYLKANAAGMPR